MIFNLESNYTYLRADMEKVYQDIANSMNGIRADDIKNIILEKTTPNVDILNILANNGFENTENGLNSFKLAVISLPLKQFSTGIVGDIDPLSNLYTADTLEDQNFAFPPQQNSDIPTYLIGNYEYLRVDYIKLLKHVAEYLDCEKNDVLNILKKNVSAELLKKIEAKGFRNLNNIILGIIQIPLKQLGGIVGDIDLLSGLYTSTIETEKISGFPDIKRGVTTVISFTMSNTALKLNDTSTVTVVFSEAVEEFSNADITVVNGSLDTMTTTDNITWIGTYTPTLNVQENFNVLILGTDWTDAAGNSYAGNATTTANFTIDTTGPTITSVKPSWGTHLNATEDNSNGTVIVETSRIENGQTVTVGLNGQNYTGTVNNDSATITILASQLQALSEGQHTITANVSDAAGNAAQQKSVTFTYDKTATISSITPSWGALLNAPEDKNDGTVAVVTSGVENGQQLTINFNSQLSLNGTVNNDSVTITILASQLQALSEGANIITANVSDAAGNAATSSVSFTYDKIAPTISSITASWGALLNALKDNNDGTVVVVTSGVENGQQLTINFNLQLSLNGTVNNDSVTLAIQASQLQALDEGLNTITANVSDATGNAAQQKSITFTYDKTAQTISSITASWGALLNATTDNVDGTVTVKTSGVENGQQLTINFNSQLSLNGTVNNDSVTITILASQLQALSEGLNTITANVSDAAGNVVLQKSISFTYDKTATISSITPSWGALLNAPEDKNDGTVAVVTSGVENGQQLTINFNSQLSLNGTVNNDSVTITILASQLQALSEGTNIITANVSDAAGNAATSSVSFTYNKSIFNLLPGTTQGETMIKLNEPKILTNNDGQKVELNLDFDTDEKTVVYQLEAKEDDGQYINYEKYIGKWRRRQWVSYTQLMNDDSPEKSAAKSHQHTKQRIMFEGITDNGEGLSVFKESCLNVDLEQIPDKNPTSAGWTMGDVLDFPKNTYGYGQLDDELYIKSNGVIFKREEKRLFLPPYQTSIWVMLYYKIYNNGDVNDARPKITVQVDLSYHQHVAYMKYGEVDWEGFKKNGLNKQNYVWGRHDNWNTPGDPNDFFQDPDPQAQYNDHGLGIDDENENKGYIETAIKLLISTEDELKAWYKTFNTYQEGEVDGIDEWGNNATGASDTSHPDFGKADEENWERRFLRDFYGPGQGNVAKAARENISQSITFGPYIKTKEDGTKDIRIFGPTGCDISANGRTAAHGQPGFDNSEFPRMIEFDLDIGKINQKNEEEEGLINIWQDISGSGLGVVQLDGDTGGNGDEIASHGYIGSIDYVDARVIAFDVSNNRYVFNKNVIEFIPIDNSDKYRIKYSPQKEYLSDSLNGGTFTVDPSVVKLELFTNITNEEIEDSPLGTALTAGLQVSVKPLFKDDTNTENVGYTTTLIFDPRLNDTNPPTFMGKLDTSVFSEFSDLMGKTEEMNREKQFLPLQTIDKSGFVASDWKSTENTTAQQRLNRHAKMEYNDDDDQVYHGTTTTN